LNLLAILLVAAAMIVTSVQAIASNATFSKDSNHVYLLNQNTDRGGLIDIDLKNKSCRQIDLDPSIGEPIEDLTQSNAGFVVFATKHSVWSYDPSKAAWAKVCDGPKGIAFTEIAYDPKTEDILAIGMSEKTDSDAIDWSILRLPKGDDKWISVRARYGTGVGHPVFAADGTMFFAYNGDLWSGVIATDDETLVAGRCAALGSLIDQNTSPASSGVREIAVAKDSIYTNYGRLNGSGWGSLIRFRRPPPLATLNDGDWSIPVDAMDWKQRQAELGSVEEISDSTSNFLCASRDGSLVFFASTSGDSDDVFLVRHGGKPAQIEIKGLSAHLK
jgi:hypothetical protein